MDARLKNLDIVDDDHVKPCLGAHAQRRPTDILRRSRPRAETEVLAAQHGIAVVVLKGIGLSLGISTNFDAVTAQYVDVRMERKQTVLETYHQKLFPKQEEPGTKPKKKKAPKQEL